MSVESRDELYFYASDLLSSVTLNPILLPVNAFIQPAVGLLESLQTGCATINIAGVQVSGDTNAPFSYDFSTTLTTMASAIADFGQNGVSINGAAQVLIPSISPCNRKPYETITHLGGSASLYVAHLGTGPYRKRISKGTFQTCKDVIIENQTTNTIELPVKVQGSVYAAGSFALDDKTFGHARLRAWGNIGGQAFDEVTEVKAADVFPAEGSIDVVRRFTVAAGQGRFAVHIDVNAESLVEVQAKGGGLFGMITASATAGVDFPNSIEIGTFTGKNGGSLPVGVKIYDATDPSSYYAMTVPVIEPLPRTGTIVPLRIYAPTGSVYQVQTSSDLRNWSPLFITNPTSGSFTCSLTNGGQSGSRFIRLCRP